MRDLLYKVLRHTASPVSVITTAHGAQRAGMTISSLTSLSMGPPDMFLTFNCQVPSRTAELMHQRNRVVLNLLSPTPPNAFVARAFAGRLKPGHDLNPFEAFPELFTASARMEDIPLVRGAAAHVLCEVDRTMRVQDHEIVVARVRDVVAGTLEPMVYHEHVFRELGPEVPGRKK